MSSSYGKAVGGKLKLKGISLSGSSSAKAAGVKRPREDDAPSSRSNSSSSSSSSASSISSSNSASTQAQRIQGSGTIITSGTTLHGIDTKFLAELSIGDAIQIVSASAMTAEAMGMQARKSMDKEEMSSCTHSIPCVTCCYLPADQSC